MTTVTIPVPSISYAIQVPDALATLDAAGYTCTPPSVVVTPPPPPPPVKTAAMTTANGTILDTNGAPFMIVGANQCHVDSSASVSYANFGINAVRCFTTSSAGTLVNDAIANLAAAVKAKVKFIWCAAYAPSGATLSGDTAAADILSTANFIASQYAALAPNQKHLIINMGNEFGPNPAGTAASQAAYLAAYQPAIKVIRAAGFTCPLMIDADGYGQSNVDLIADAAALKAADPLGNIVLSYHLYGGAGYPGTTEAAQETLMQTLVASLGAAQKSTGIPFVVGEFGPGQNIGPSPTLISPAAVVAACKSAGIGWMPWALDDNDLAGSASDQKWFSMTLGGTVNGVYLGSGYYDGKTAAQLTTYGQTMVPLIKAAAVAATDF